MRTHTTPKGILIAVLGGWPGTMATSVKHGRATPRSGVNLPGWTDWRIMSNVIPVRGGVRSGAN